MPPKKKQGLSKTDIKPDPVADEKPVTDESGYTMTGSIEVDFPEFLKALGCTHPPAVTLIKLNPSQDDHSDPESRSNQTLPRVIFFYREETEGKNQVQYISSAQLRNFKIRDIEAKVLSRCFATCDKLETVYFVRTGLTGSVFKQIALPATVKNVQIYLNPNDGDLWEAAAQKGVANIGLQENSIKSHQLISLTKVIPSNNHLCTINLSNNPHLGDEAIKHLARALITNKKLVAISASNCGLTDETIDHFVEAMGKEVKMIPEEIYQWRKKRMELIISSDSQLRLPPPKQKRDEPKAKATPPPRKTRGAKDAPDKKRKSQTWASSSSTEAAKPLPKPTPKVIHFPDDTGIKRIDKIMLQPGNRTLCNINLSRNKITVYGMIKFAKLLGSQLEMTSDTIALRQVNLAKNQKIWKFKEGTDASAAVVELTEKLKQLEKSKWADCLRNMGNGPHQSNTDAAQPLSKKGH